MNAKSTRPSAKREVQKERSAKRDVQKFRSAQRDDRVLQSAKRDNRVLRSAKRDDRIARPRRAQTCERSELRAKRAMRMCPRSGQIFKMTIRHVRRKLRHWLDCNPAEVNQLDN